MGTILDTCVMMLLLNISEKIISILKQHHTSKNIHTYQKCSGEMKLNSLEELQHFIR